MGSFHCGSRSLFSPLQMSVKSLSLGHHLQGQGSQCCHILKTQAQFFTPKGREAPKGSADPCKPHLLQKGSPGHHWPLLMLFLLFPGQCMLPPVSEMMDDIDEKMGKKLKW